MKKGLLPLALALASVGMAQAKGASDPVLMTIKGKPVTLSEFEYLYHKNNSQQITPQSIEEYLQMFITYKQKVADAEAEGIDRTEAFSNEYDGYRRELAEPYLRDQQVEDSLINVVYNRMKEDVDVSHIMLANQGPGINPGEQKARLDSIRTAILGGSDFEELARRFSIDRSVTRNGGHMGYIAAAKFPYVFEDAAYDTPTGQISPVIETPFGYHIVKVHGRRPARGQVLVEHILKLTQGLNPEEAERKKEQIDSIAGVLAAGADFEDVARRESEDPGTRPNGGKLGWFGTGQMVPEFEEASFSLSDGEISAPVQTAYGYHIIKRLEGKGVEPMETMAPIIKQVLQRDERAQLPRKRKVAALRKKYGVAPYYDALAKVKEEIVANGGLDSVLAAKYTASNTPIAKIGGSKIPLSEIMAEISLPLPGDAEAQAARFEELLGENLDNNAVEAERNNLAKENADYRNLLNEYRDGMLLFEVSDRKVWQKAKQDKEGLAAFFEANRDKYRWEKPKYKGYVVFATSDSLLNAAKSFLGQREISSDSLQTELRKQFGKDVKIEKVIAAQGENAITDFLGFGAVKPEPKGKWAHYFPYRDKVLEAPEEPADVRGAVTGDYQNELERQWIEQLKKAYPAKVNKKVLKKAK